MVKHPRQLKRLTVLVGGDDIAGLKHLAVDRKISASKIVRSVVSDFLKSEAVNRTPSSPQPAEGGVRRG